MLFTNPLIYQLMKHGCDISPKVRRPRLKYICREAGAFCGLALATVSKTKSIVDTKSCKRHRVASFPSNVQPPNQKLQEAFLPRCCVWVNVSRMNPQQLQVCCENVQLYQAQQTNLTPRPKGAARWPLGEARSST